MTKRNLTKHRSLKTLPPLMLNPGRKYKYLWENGAAIMLMIGADGRVIDANNALLEMSGYSWHEVVGKNVLDFVVPEYREKAAAQIQAALTHGAASQFEVMFRGKDGSNRALLLPPKQLVLEENGQRSILVMGVDSTERAKYETMLQALHTHASQLSSAENIDTIVNYTLDAMEFTLGLKHSYFLLVENASLQIRGSRGRHVAYSAMPLDGRGMTVRAANTKATLRISDTRKEPGFVDPKGYDWTGPPTALSELVVPVLINAETVAVLCVDSPRLGNFTDDDQRLLETLAIHVGLALERLRHGDELESVARFSSENPNPVFRLNENGIILYANQASNALLQKWRCKVGGICPKFWQDLVKELLTHQTSKTVDIDFEERAYAIQLTPVLGAGYVNAYGRDITERAHMEKVLQESEEKYRALVENSPNLIGILQDGVLKYVNSAVIFKLGWTYEQLVSPSFDPIENVVSQKSRSLLKENVGKRLRGEDIAPYEISLTRKDGSEVPVLVRGTKIIYKQKPAIEFVFDDITERKLAENTLKQSEKRFREAMEATNDGLWDWNVETGEFYYSPAYYRMLGYEPGDFSTNIQFWLDHIHPDDRALALQMNEDCIENRVSNFEVEFRMRTKSGEWKWILGRGRASARDAHGRALRMIGTHQDITERKRMEEELSRSSQFLASVIENAYVWLDVLDSQQNVLIWNKAAETMSGYSREEVGRHGKIWELLYPDQEYRKQTMETVSNILQNGRTDVDTETRIKRKDGQTRIISWNERALTDQGGKAIGTIAIGHDITERKKIEEKLRQSEERYRSLFDRMLDGVYRSTREGRFIDINPAFVEMFGYSSNEEMLDIMDIKKELYFSPEERGSHILDADQESVKVYRMRRKDGSEVWVEDHGRYVHDEQGNIIYHEGILRDVTERKGLEEKLKQYSLHLEELVAERTRELQESEEKYHDLFEACPVSLWEEDFSAVKQFLGELRQKGVSDFGAYLANHPEDIAKCAGLVKVLNMNKATLAFYDAKSVDEVTGGLSGFLTEKSNRAFVGELVALVEGKKYYEAEFENKTLRGETKHCNVICAAVPGYEQTLAKVLICVVDLTPQKRLEAELVKSQRLAAIGETAAMVGHDLRNPLQGIAGALHLLRHESLTTNERDEMLQLIQSSVEYADGIVRDLSEYSAEIILELADTTPKLLAREAIQTVKVPPTVLVQDLSQNYPTLKVDTGKIKRVLVNLIENAIGAMPQGGTLMISSRLRNDTVEIAFSDTGSGMPEKVMKNLWRPLQTTKAKGLGLGLPICKRIVDAHGGTISVKSKTGEGTTVTIGLPMKPVAVEVKEK